MENSADAAVNSDAVNNVPIPAQPASDPSTVIPNVAASAAPLHPSRVAAPAPSSITPQETASVSPTASPAVPLGPTQPAVPARPVATLSAVRDELVSEDSEVKVYATGVFENCPDAELSECYFESLKKFILSEKHLEENISSVKIAQMSSQQLRSLYFVHRVKVEITVKLEGLSETPLEYLKKHLATNDWLKGNKTRITVNMFHMK